MFSVDALCKGYDTNIETGLTEEQAQVNLNKFGPNKIKKKNIPESVMVKREGEFKKINTSDLVPGDVTIIEADSFIAGDVRIVKILEPILVESYFLYRECVNYMKEMTVDQTSEDPLKTNNLIFYGTSTFSGRCLGLIFQTGEKMLLSDITDDILADPATKSKKG